MLNGPLEPPVRVWGVLSKPWPWSAHLPKAFMLMDPLLLQVHLPGAGEA